MGFSSPHRSSEHSVHLPRAVFSLWKEGRLHRAVSRALPEPLCLSPEKLPTDWGKQKSGGESLACLPSPQCPHCLTAAPLLPQTLTTSTSSQRTRGSWAWWCAGALRWCSSARRTAWRPSPTPSSSSRMPSSQATHPNGTLFCITYIFVFLIKLQTSSVQEPWNLPFGFGVPVKPRPGDLVHLAELEHWLGTWR